MTLSVLFLLLFVLGSQIKEAFCLCFKSSDCTCDGVCKDAEGVIYGSLVCAFDQQCYCNSVTGDCQYSRGPVTDPPTDVPTISSPPSTSTPTKSSKPSLRPSANPSVRESSRPSGTPSEYPTFKPSIKASSIPSLRPSSLPSIDSSSKPSQAPSEMPSLNSTNKPSPSPSTEDPTSSPSEALSLVPSGSPTSSFSDKPSQFPSEMPSIVSTNRPSSSPLTEIPTSSPSETLSLSPSATPTSFVIYDPSQSPSESPSSAHPAAYPSLSPSTEFPSSFPSARPTGGCDNPEEECGWGVWNPWTCQCDCAPGFCLSANQRCYDGCTTHIDFNPFGGCIPGYDCPWYPSKMGETHCKSTPVIAGIYNIYRKVKECCEKHFSALNIDTCISDSKASVETAADETEVISTRTKYFYPDLYGRDNCVFNQYYYDWMMESHTEWYVFESESECCKKWYPNRLDCPDLTATTQNGVEENPYPVTGYFYPHMVDSNCRFGRNYPQWMVQEMYIKHYLYTTPEECCSMWYPSSYNCPSTPDDGVQDGKYWIVDAAYYPNWKGNYCALGNTYPEWMADPMNRDWHLFDSAKDCCEKWFPHNPVECEINVAISYNGSDGSSSSKRWYPTTYPFKCLEVDDNTPRWMQQEGYLQYYIFDSHAECCKAHYCT
mmetsp:Transcript_15776/g.32987  ORF Transcript_15776/g.32987 Transcript_15776/m.32987 type:complete len:657 (-) Transcript_15776:54-2024(-)